MQQRATDGPSHPHGADFLIRLMPPPPHLLHFPGLLCDVPFVAVDGWHVHPDEEVAVHVVGARYVVDVCGVGVQVDRVIRDEVSIDDGDEGQIVQLGVWG